jgi:high-affinity Fe2+/Pb2+ permease
VISLTHYTRFIGRDSAMSELMWLVADLSPTENGVGTRLFYIVVMVDKKTGQVLFRLFLYFLVNGILAIPTLITSLGYHRRCTNTTVDGTVK